MECKKSGQLKKNFLPCTAEGVPKQILKSERREAKGETRPDIYTVSGNSRSIFFNFYLNIYLFFYIINLIFIVKLLKKIFFSTTKRKIKNLKKFNNNKIILIIL